jgi:uncharacterized protein
MMTEYSFVRHRLSAFNEGEDDAFWRSLEDGVFRLPRCAGCGRWRWESVRAIFGAPVPRCGDCGTWDMTWVDMDMRGTVYSWVRTTQPFPRTPERRGQIPYVTVEVAIDGTPGLRVLGILGGSDVGLRVGAKVCGSIEPPAEISKWYPSLMWALETAENLDGTANV